MNTNQFLKPKFTLSEEDKNNNYMEFTVNQLERGFGVTLGNALRRTLLSSVPGVAIYAIKITGVSHEFSSIPGVIENVSEIVLNIKNIVLKADELDDFSEEDEIQNLTLTVKGQETITAEDIVCPAGVKVVNKDLVIARTTSRNSEITIDFYVRKSRGYASFEYNKKLVSNGQGIIPIDSNFSPVTKVTYHVEPITKTLKGVDYEKLILTVQTNGSINATNAISVAAKIFFAHLELFVNLNEEVRNFEVIAANDVKSDLILELPLEELNLTVRSYNCLKRDGFKTLGDITNKSLEEIAQIKNLGSKSVTEIQEMVKRYNLEFLRRD